MPSGISPGGRPINESSLNRSPRKNWVEKRGGLPPYVRGVARGIAKKHGGKVTSNDIQIAIGVMKNWASGRGNVRPQVRAAAAAAVARWEAMKGSKSHNLSYDPGAVKQIDLNWDAFDEARGKHPRQKGAQSTATGTIAGYSGPAMSASTINAIKSYQKANGLPQTGNLDSRTLSMANGSTKKAAAAAKKAAGKAKKAAKGAGSKAKKAAGKAKSSAKKRTAAKKKVAAAQKKSAKALTAAYKKREAARKKIAAVKVSAQKKAVAAAKRKAVRIAAAQKKMNSIHRKQAEINEKAALKSKGRQ